MEERRGNGHRLFLALTPPAELVRELEALGRQQREELPEFRWMGATGFHLTLRFLGETPPERLESIRRTVGALAADIPPLALRATGWGAFPHPAQTRVLWLGMGEAEKNGIGLMRLAHELAAALPGAEARERPFLPHLTMARARSPRPLTQAILKGIPVPVTPWTAGELHAIASTLTPAGARYRLLFSIPLGGG